MGSFAPFSNLIKILKLRQVRHEKAETLQIQKFNRSRRIPRWKIRSKRREEAGKEEGYSGTGQATESVQPNKETSKNDKGKF